MLQKNTSHNEKAWYISYLHGFYASLFSFAFIWPIDTTSTRLRFYQKQIFQNNLSQSFENYLNAISPNQTYTGKIPLLKSFFNKGIYWGLSYHLTASTLTFPAQTYLQHYFLTHFNTHKDNTIFVSALAGWIVALTQLTLMHPLDSMKISAQKNPEIFQNNMKHYFLTKQPELRRGMGVVALGSVSHFIAWYAKLSIAFFLENKIANNNLNTMLSAITFSITHMIFAYPMNTIKTWAQGDFSYNPRYQSFLNKAAKTAEITCENIKVMGPTALYRGFFSRGCMHMTSFSLTMGIYDALQRKT